MFAMWPFDTSNLRIVVSTPSRRLCSRDWTISYLTFCSILSNVWKIHSWRAHLYGQPCAISPLFERSELDKVEDISIHQKNRGFRSVWCLAWKLNGKNFILSYFYRTLTAFQLWSVIPGHFRSRAHIMTYRVSKNRSQNTFSTARKSSASSLSHRFLWYLQLCSTPRARREAKSREASKADHTGRHGLYELDSWNRRNEVGLWICFSVARSWAVLRRSTYWKGLGGKGTREEGDQ